MRTIKYILAGVMILITSCSEDFVDLTNPSEQSTFGFWKTEKDAVLATNAMYQALIYDGTYMRFGPWVLDVRADDVISTTPGYYPEDVANYIVDENNLAYIDIWRHNYIGVWRANQVLGRLPDIPMDANIKARCLGEAHFIRGLCYFNLLINFRNIVICEKEVGTVDDYYIPQSSPDTAWQVTIQDFKKAIDGCWLKSDPKNEMGRATKGAAAAFLAKSYMINHYFDSAAVVLKDIMNTADGGNQLYGEYSLVDEYRHNFLEGVNDEFENNAESLFEIQYKEVDGTSVQGFDLNPASDWMKTDGCHKGMAAKPFGWGDLAPTPWIYQEFQLEQTVDGKRDPRMEASLFFPHPDSAEYTVYGYPGDSMLMEMEWATPDDLPDDFYVYIKKWLTEDEAIEMAWRSTINRRIMRYADVLLLYAECLNEAGQTAQAYTYIQKVRDRANLPDLATVKPGMTQQQMREQLDHERALEFCFEAWRLVDLLRWGYFDDPAKVELLRSRDVEFNNWTTGREYLAIPPGEITRTRGIVKQNPGWS